MTVKMNECEYGFMNKTPDKTSLELDDDKQETGARENRMEGGCCHG